MKKFTLLLILSFLIFNCAFALIEAPEKYRIKTSGEKVEKTVKKVPSIPTFDETVVEIQEEVLPSKKVAPVTEEKSLLSMLAKIITITLIMAIVVLGLWMLINRKRP